jgi:arylsulfatase A-like enzyme
MQRLIKMIFYTKQLVVWSASIVRSCRLGGVVPCLVGLLLLSCSSCNTAPPEGKNVVLVVVEALPANSLGCYGGEVPVSRHLDELAEDGILFERFHSASPWTMPSFGTILTGLAPPLHRAGRFMPDPTVPGKLSADIFGLLENIPFLPELLDGVVTSAVVNNSFLHKDYGFERGWTNYDQQKAGYTGYRLGPDTTEKAIQLLEKHRSDRHFMMVHYFDPHLPYRPPFPYKEKFDLGKKGRIQMKTVQQLKDMRHDKFWPNTEEQQYLKGLHDGEIAFTDAEIHKLVEAMDNMRILDETWLVITADHGEELFEHGGFEHGHRYEEEVTKVPLIIRPPGGRWKRGTRVETAARHIDLAPTILHWFGKQVPRQMEGESLMSLITGSDKEHRPTYMGFNLTGEPAHSFFDGRYKMIETMDKKDIYLYDVDEDPKETKRLGKDHPRFESMKRQLHTIHDRYEKKAKDIFSKRNDKKISEEVLESLRSLGYID